MGKYVGEEIAGGGIIIFWKSKKTEIDFFTGRILNPKVELTTFACLRTHVRTILLENILKSKRNIISQGGKIE